MGLFLSALLLLLPAAGATAQEMSRPEGDGRAGLEEIIRNYLLSHPEVILESLNRMEQRVREERAGEMRALIGENNRELREDGQEMAKGAAAVAAAVTIVEFADYRCGYCKRVYPVIVEALARHSDVRLLVKEFPVLGPDSVTAARVAIAARKQGRYGETHDALMSAPRLDRERIFAIARGLGLDMTRLETEMAAPETQDIIDRNRALADRLGVAGTPAFVIGDYLLPGAISGEDMEKAIGLARDRCESCG